MLIYIVDPYYNASHRMWAQGIKSNSKFEVEIFSMSPNYWTWRMQGSAYTMSKRVSSSNVRPDLIMVTDMIDLPLLKNLLPKNWNVPYVLYMHENQLTYPLSQYTQDKYQDLSYGYMNYKSCLVADYILFNSEYHSNTFLKACQILLHKMPDNKNLETIDLIKRKSQVIPIGLNLDQIEKVVKQTGNTTVNKRIPSLLFNHRWEYDKRPEVFINLIDSLLENKLEFKINITSKLSPSDAEKLKSKYGKYLNHIGNITSYESYLKLVSQSNILPVTSIHDFFGISVLEAIHCGCYPILPSDLCYQEHFISYNEEYFYKDDTDLFKKTTEIIQLFSGINESCKSNFKLKNFDWNDIIKFYDMFFSNCFDDDF